MILYGRAARPGTEDVLDAVDVLAGHIFQVHAKDATWSARPGLDWGQEVPAGRGAGGLPRFLARLAAVNFAGA